VGHKIAQEINVVIEEMLVEALQQGSTLRPYGSRMESTPDGAGVEHYTLYVGYAPAVPSSEPLDPHNMNDAPPPQPGMPEPTDGIMPLGSRETKF
jgi:hypothetical protein